MTHAPSDTRQPTRRAWWHASLLAVLLAPAAAPAQDAAPAPVFEPGMSWTYRQREELGGREGAGIRIEVVAATAGRVTVSVALAGEAAVNERWDAAGNWEQVSARGWAWLERLGGAARRVEFVPALPLYRFPLEVGKSWVDTVQAVDPGSGRKTTVKVFAKAIGWDEVVVPAGKFRALKVRRSIAPEDGDTTRTHTTVTLIDWYAPQVDGTVKRICDWEYHDRRRPLTEQLTRGPRLRIELAAFEPPR